MVISHLLYISDAVHRFDQDQLEAIRYVSARNNAKRDVTGVLFYSEGHFIQLLEGDPKEIHALFEKIATDPRHHQLRLLAFRPAEKRVFTNWSMGLLNLSQHGSEQRDELTELVRLAGMSDASSFGTSVEIEILDRFRTLLPAG